MKGVIGGDFMHGFIGGDFKILFVACAGRPRRRQVSGNIISGMSGIILKQVAFDDNDTGCILTV